MSKWLRFVNIISVCCIISTALLVLRGRWMGIWYQELPHLGRGISCLLAVPIHQVALVLVRRGGAGAPSLDVSTTRSHISVYGTTAAVVIALSFRREAEVSILASLIGSMVWGEPSDGTWPICHLAPINVLISAVTVVWMHATQHAGLRVVGFLLILWSSCVWWEPIVAFVKVLHLCCCLGFYLIYNTNLT